MDVRIRNVTIDDLDECYYIESKSYGSEGASKASIKKRIEEYPIGFHVLTINEVIVGFINSGCTNKTDLADEEIKSLIGHDPEGKYLVVFSLVVHPEHRNQKHSYKLLEHYTTFADGNNKDILLMCKKELIPLYGKFGFKEIGKSESTHGGIEWFEMSRNQL